MNEENKEKMITISEKVYNRKIKFDTYWKIALLIVLVISIAYMFYEWRTMGTEGLACRSAPFEWGQQQAQKEGISCFYECFDDGIDRINKFTITTHLP